MPAVDATLTKLQRLLSLIAAMPESFYARRLPWLTGRREKTAAISLTARVASEPTMISSIADFVARVPFTTKDEILQDRLLHPPFGTNFTENLGRYTRFCQTSGTSTGQPMAVLDTPESWEAMLTCWRRVYKMAALRPGPPAEPGADAALSLLVPSFLLSEIERAFEIGFLLFLPFLIIDLVVSAVLMSMGMMMVPPVIVSMPFKLAFFVVADGWSLVSSSLVRSYF